jgi:hypothetical protein
MFSDQELMISANRLRVQEKTLMASSSLGNQLPNDTLCLTRRQSTMKLITERQNDVHLKFPASKKARNSPQKNKKLNV